MSKTKTGRKQKHYETSWGETVVGLSKRPSDGRWRVIGTQTTFAEADERKAVARFRSITDPIRANQDRVLPNGQTVKAVLDTLEKNLAEIDNNFAEFVAQRDKQFWGYVADEIYARPKWVAEQTGIEQIGYLLDLKKPLPLPTFADLRKIYLDHARCSPDQRQKVLRAWDDLVTTTKIEGLRGVTAEVALQFRDTVWDRLVIPRGEKEPRPIGPKQQSHIFNGIRGLLRFCKKRGVAVEAIAKALNALECLEPNDTANDSNPHPISVEEWKALYGKAEGQDKAFILLMLNACLYVREVLSLDWEDIDLAKGVIVTRRKKRGKCIRVCVLWAETIEALLAIRGNSKTIFTNYAKEPLGISGAQLRFTELAKKAKVAVTGSQIRDGAYTAAVDAKVPFELCNLLGGHKIGIEDKYVLRQPSMVAPACKAVYDYYFA